MTKKLISLEEHNKTGGNGIACPNCGSELFDYPGAIMLYTSPGQYPIFCRNCNYKGTRY